MILNAIEMSFVLKLFETELVLAMKFYCTLANQLAENLIMAGSGKFLESSMVTVDADIHSMKEVEISWKFRK